MESPGVRATIGSPHALCVASRQHDMENLSVDWNGTVLCPPGLNRQCDVILQQAAFGRPYRGRGQQLWNC